MTAGSAIAGGAASWATLQARVKQNERDILKVDARVDRVETEFSAAINKILDKIDRVYEHIINLKA